MNNSDLINGLFEFSSALFTGINIRRLYLDKQVKGVSIIPLIYFTSWGVWNLYFYPANGLFLSFLGGCFITLANAIYIAQMVYYNQLNKKP